MDAILQAEGLRKRYAMGEVGVEALKGVDFILRPGEFVAIMGPSGSGKSTLLHLLGGLDEVSAGEVTLAGRRLAQLKDDQLTLLRRRHVGFVFQFYNLLPTLTAAENIGLPLLLDGSLDAAAEARIAELLAMVGLAERADHRPAQLSGGEQQRVAVARALVTEPLLVLADEPTGNLNRKAGSEVLSLLRRACDERGQTIVIVTHDPYAASRSDRAVFLKDGAIVRELQLVDAEDRVQSIVDAMAELEL